ncbi:NADH-quinone oxidoreductase subunit NuoN [Schaalia sp. 19OD2882]|uniref:NADH-quinone oxidoreductase subunit NuoN n=1 Tax=Schaalia sp. 19OD2882 TaxID=2794089 RepID=UPI001C1F1EA9|nr:NADH-quinone oxidoreductase subunit NuoN [Schaalia sp. 19OD2882]QWW19887.1 NADH-quinone oxidoreductase subunit NuoN [Schaalia sp. 19OD2882]
MNLLASAVIEAPTIAWLSLVPVMIVIGGAVLAVLLESFAPVGVRRLCVIATSLLVTLAAAVALISRWMSVTGALAHRADITPAELPAVDGEYLEDPLTLGAQLVLVLVAFLAFLVMADRTAVGDGAFAGQPSDRPGSHDEELSDQKGYQRSEMFALGLFSLGGMMVFPAANSFVALFVALEVMSLPLYILAATARRRRQLSQEAGIKYFILGAFSSGFMLMGSAFLYGISGTLTISKVADVLSTSVRTDWLALTGIFMVMVGLLFKVGAAPFHAWTPDVYTGAPTPVTGFMAAAVKVAAFAAMLRFHSVIAAIMQWDLMPVFLAVAVLTMLVGTFAGLVQFDVKRMLAYSSIAHAGFVLLGVFSLVEGSSGHVLFYLIGYGLATVGAFAVVSLVRSVDSEGVIGGEVTDIRRWAGLGRSNPWIGGAMLLFLLSFAGIPLTAGFIGKFVVFSDAFAAGFGWFVAVALLCSAVTAFFYFRLVRLLFFTEPSGDVVVARSEGLSMIAIILSVAGTIALGVFPSPVLSLLNQVVILLP